MSENLKTKISLFFCLFLLTTCSPQRQVAYPLPNPVLVAFNHQLDFTSWRDTLEKDASISVITVDGGLVLFSNTMGQIFRFWINDSLLIVQLDATYSFPLLGVADQTIFETKRRRSNADLATSINDLFPEEVYFTTSPVDDDPTAISITGNTDLFQIEREQLHPVDSLTWHSSAFDEEVSYRFVDGRLQGQFTTLDSLGLLQIGQFQEGAEFGIWEYRDTLGNLQYTEEYALGGELQKVRYEKGATFTRGKPLPTLRYLWIIHRIMFGLFCSVSAYVLFRYFHSLRRFQKPYGGESAMQIFLSILIVSPILALGMGMVAVFLIMAISSGLGPLLGWDLPLHFLAVLQGLLIFPIIECGWLWITHRFNDAIWHGALLVLAILILGEWHFLTTLIEII
ncbi:MAG: hypothetical protein ACRBG0_23805 [Lewinella sp.]|uniref:hypothetical protein n=1 Tax=Lewinella sp. TaxID=2004506 RepID=UPI003D6A8296